MATVGTVIIDVKADTAKLVSGMEKAENSIKNTVGGIKTAIISMATAYVGIQGVKAFTNIINDSLDAADATGKLAQKLGLTTDSLSEYQYAAGFAAVSNGELNAGLSALIRRLNNFERTGGGAAKKAFEELGISAEYARKHFTSTDIAFKEILKRLEKMPDGFKKTAIAQDIFSKSASGIMRITATDLKKFSEEAQKIGISISQSTYNMAAAYHDEMDQIDARMKGFKQTIAFSVVAPMNAASKTALEMVDNMFGSTTKEQMKNFENIAVEVISNVVYSIGFIKDAFTGIELVIDGLKLGFYALAGVAATAMEPVRILINNMVDAYNFLAEKLDMDKIGYKLESSLPDIADKISAITKEMVDLNDSLTNGRTTADEYVKKFKNNFVALKEESKKVKKEIKEINDGDLTGFSSGNKNKLKALELSPKAQNSLEQYRKALELIADPIDTINDKYLSMYDVIKDTFDEKQLQKFYKKWQSEIDATNKKAKEYEGLGSRDWASGLKGQAKDIANVSNALRDIGTEQKKWQKFQQESIVTDKDKQVHLEAQMGAYSMLAGTIGSAAKEGSDAAIAATTAQATLGIASSWTAIANAWALPFPANLGAVAMVAAQVMPIIQQLGGSGDSSGGSSVSIPSVAETKIAETNDYYDTVIGKFDRQIELLEQLNQGGTAEKLKLINSRYKFQQEDLLSGIGVRSLIEDKMKEISNKAGVDINSFYNANYAEHGIVDPVKFFSSKEVPKLFEGFFGNTAQAKVFNNWWEDVYGLTTAEFHKMQGEFQQSITDFASSVIESIQNLQDYSSKLKDTYDSITGSTKYQTETLLKAQSVVNNLRGDKSVAEYIQTQIEAISTLNDTLSQSEIEILANQDPSNMQMKIDLINELVDRVGGVYSASDIENAINYSDAIALVSEAIVKSNDNIKTWEDSFKTERELARDLMLNVANSQLATSMEELNAIFKRMANDADGLTDAELEALNANKALLDARKKVFDDTLDGWMTSLQDASKKALDTSNSLIGLSQSKTLSDYYSSMATTKSLLEAGKYDDFVKSLDTTIGLTSVLKDTSNFSSENDMLFNQLVAARQFEDISTKSQSQYDILKQIAETNSDLFKTQQEQNQLIEAQANEILKMRKEIQDQTAILDEIAGAA